MKKFDIDKYLYSPILKTSDAELKGFDRLDGRTKAQVIPLFELTKSRIHKTANPDGDVYRRVDKLIEVSDNNPFILDLIGYEKYQNKQIKSYFIEDDGYKNWQEFLSSIDCENIIPTILLDGEADIENIKKQARELEKEFGVVCLRIGCFEPDDEDSSIGEFFDDDINDFVQPVFESLNDVSKCLVVIDAGFIPYGKLKQFSDFITEMMDTIIGLGYGAPMRFVPSGSSFPQMVAKGHYGDDRYGLFPMLEWNLFKTLTADTDYELIYSDYASIHPFKYDAIGYNWVPRVDAPMEDEYIYHRYRREVKGYAHAGYDLAAKQMLNDGKYLSCGSWGDDQIVKADNHDGDVGRGPASWIAIRANIHMTRRVQLLTR